MLNSSVSVKTIDDMIGDYDIFNDLEGGFIKVNAYLLSSGNAFVLEARKSG